MKKKELKRQLKAERQNKRTSNLIHNPSMEMVNTQSIWHDAILDIEKLVRQEMNGVAVGISWGKKRKPRVGDWVHYINAAGNHMAAVITNPEWEQHEDGTYSQALTVFVPWGLPVSSSAAEGPDMGDWHWPEE